MPIAPRGTLFAWPRLRVAAAQIVIIVAGVLAALAVDEWQDDRREHVMEREYAARLHADLTADMAVLDGYRDVLGDKVEGLRLLAENAGGRLTLDRMPAERIGHTRFHGLPSLRAATFLELQSTGSLRLLRDPVLRQHVVEHYVEYAGVAGIMSQRWGDYLELSAGAIPGAAQYAARLGTGEVDVAGLEAGLARLLADPGLEAAVNAEMAYAGALVYWLDVATARGAALRDRIAEAYELDP